MLLIADIVIILLIIFVILFVSYFCWVSNLDIVDEEKAIFVIYLVEALGKICPVHSSTQWKQSQGAFRCWQRIFPVKAWDTSFPIFGCSTLIKASSIAVLKMVGNTSNWCNWYPDATIKEFTVQHFDEEDFMQDEYMNCTKVISGKTQLEFYRFSQMAANNVGWVLFWRVGKVEWHFYLVQPDRDGKNRCVLTCICSSNKRSVQHLATTVYAIRDVIEINTSNIISFSSSLSYDSQKSFCIEYNSEKSEATDFNFSPGFLKKPQKNKRKGVKLFKLVPHFKVGKYIKKGISHVQLAVEIVEEEAKKSIKVEIKKCLRNVKRISHETTKSSENLTAPPNRKLTDPLSAAESKSLEEKPCVLPPSPVRRTQTVHLEAENYLQALPPRQRWFSESNLSNCTKAPLTEFHSLQNPLLEEDENLNNENDSAEDLETLVAHSEEEHSPMLNSDFEMILPPPKFSVFRFADLLTKGNYSASQIQTELLKASSVNLQSSNEHQCASNNGWAFHSFYKGMTVLTKSSYCGTLKTISYLCETEIPRKASCVWESIRNPRLSFVFDETVKKVQILEEISADQKIIHIYHEINTLLKKETIDFCLLYTERQERSKYYLALHSVEYMNCPLMDSTIRGTLLPSGWIVEPSSTNEMKTKVTYLYQIIVNNPRSQFLNDLSSSVPISVQNVKEHVMFAPVSLMK